MRRRNLPGALLLLLSALLPLHARAQDAPVSGAPVSAALAEAVSGAPGALWIASGPLRCILPLASPRARESPRSAHNGFERSAACLRRGA